MQRIKIQKSISGTDFKGKDFRFGKGAVVVVDDDLAKDLINHNLALPADGKEVTQFTGNKIPKAEPVVHTAVIRNKRNTRGKRK